MQSLNIFIIGEGKIYPQLIRSKLLNKLYTSSETLGENTIPIPFDTIENLIRKCKGLQVDVVIIEDYELMSIGVTDMLRQNHINCFGANKVWAELLQDDLCSRKLANRYRILKPKVLTYPKEFPLVLKSDNFSSIAHSLSELLKIKENLPASAQNTYLEEFIEGEEIVLTSLYDGKNLLSFPPDNLNEKQEKKLNDYSAKLRTLLQEEKADFLGFVNSKLIWQDNNWYNLGFDLNYHAPKLNSQDLLFILTSAIYQKLNEISLS